MNNILVFDFETTGLLHEENVQPIEFFGLNVNEKFNKVYEGHWLIKAPNPLKPVITEITGITDSELNEHGISLDAFLVRLDKIFSHTYDFVIGHNIITFDIPLAEMLLNRSIRKDNIFDTAGAFKSTLIGNEKYHNESYYDFHKRALSTMRRGLKFNLSLAIDHYNIPKIEGGLHRASTDVKYTYEIFKKQFY